MIDVALKGVLFLFFFFFYIYVYVLITLKTLQKQKKKIYFISFTNNIKLKRDMAYSKLNPQNKWVGKTGVKGVYIPWQAAVLLLPNIKVTLSMAGCPGGLYTPT